MRAPEPRPSPLTIVGAGIPVLILRRTTMPHFSPAPPLSMSQPHPIATFDGTLARETSQASITPRPLVPTHLHLPDFVLMLLMFGRQFRDCFRISSFPAVAARKNVFDALVCWELVGLCGPGGGEGAPVHVLEVGLVAAFAYHGDRYLTSFC